MMKLSELTFALQEGLVKLEKAKMEILDELASLRADLADMPVPSSVEAALLRLTAIAQELDDIVPDDIVPDEHAG